MQRVQKKGKEIGDVEETGAATLTSLQQHVAEVSREEAHQEEAVQEMTKASISNHQTKLEEMEETVKAKLCLLGDELNRNRGSGNSSIILGTGSLIHFTQYFFF